MKRTIGFAARSGGLAAALLLAGGHPAAAQAPTGVDPKVIADLVLANHILYHQGVVDGYGHVSVRHPTRPDRFLLAAANAPGRVTAEDIMEFDLDAKPIDGRGRPTYSERFIHSEIYKVRPDVMSIVHSHSPNVVPFTVTQVPLRPIHNTASFLAPKVPVFDMRTQFGMTNNLVVNAAKGKAVADMLADRPVILLRGHGDVVVGPELRRTVARAIYTEVNAKMLVQAITLGGPINFIDPEEAKLSEGARDNPAENARGTDRTWDMWADEARAGERGH
jgi:ribulose-5-phosphate 4-epimerase/fuculose-1-phosphate aldolase